MILIEKMPVNLTNKVDGILKGHISLYQTDDGHDQWVYFVEQRFYYSKTIDKSTGRMVEEEGSDSGYHYTIDILFKNKIDELVVGKKF